MHVLGSHTKPTASGSRGQGLGTHVVRNLPGDSGATSRTGCAADSPAFRMHTCNLAHSEGTAGTHMATQPIAEKAGLQNFSSG